MPSFFSDLGLRGLRRERGGMTFSRFALAVAGLVLSSAGCVQHGLNREPGEKWVKAKGISFAYSSLDFQSCTVSRDPKLTADENGTDIPLDVGPERTVVRLADKRPLPALANGPRYFLPTQSLIAIIPLSDPSSKDFARDYPQVQEAATSLKELLSEKPETLGQGVRVPDLPMIESSQVIHSKVEYLDFPGFACVSFLTQYTQEDLGNPINNEELTLNVKGLTPDGRTYVAARFAVTHPSLPAGIDDANRIERDAGGLYLQEAEVSLNGRPDDSFSPSLARLKTLLSSLKIHEP